jgi:hypothetical protein
MSAASLGFSLWIRVKLTSQRAGAIDIPTSVLTPALVLVTSWAAPDCC